MIDEKNFVFGDIKKASILLLSLTDENAAKILKLLPENDVQLLSQEIASLEDVDEQEISNAFTYFLEKTNNLSLLGGSITKLKRVLNKTYDEEKVSSIINEINFSSKSVWKQLSEVKNEILSNYLKNEYPQTAALILHKLPAEKSAQILKTFHDDFSFEIIKRILNIEKINVKALSSLEATVRDDLINKADSLDTVDNSRFIADILVNFDRKTEHLYLDKISQYSSFKGDSVRKHILMFEDILKLDDFSMQSLIKYVDKSAVPKSLKFASKKMKDHFFKNMSTRASKIVLEEIDGLRFLTEEESELSQKEVISTLKKLINNKSVRFERD